MTAEHWIDPEKMGQAVIKRFDKEGRIANGVVLPVYRTRWWNFSRKWQGPALMFEILGCDEDCAHCYVPIPLLRADINSGIFQKRISELPVSLRVFPQTIDELSIYAKQQFRTKGKESAGPVIELTGGEPMIYSHSVLELAKQCHNEGIILGINTNGFKIAKTDILAEFDGLQDTVKFLVSVKGISPEEFAKFSGARPEYFLTPFEAARRIALSGFPQPFLGVTVDTITRPGEEEADLVRLMELIDEFGLDPNMIIWDKITEQIMGNWFPTRDKMLDRGYYRKEGEKVVRQTNTRSVMKILEESYGINRCKIK